MRFSLRKTILALLVIVVVQLTVYFWVIAPGRSKRTRTLVLPRLQSLLRPPPAAKKTGTCDDSRCPGVKEGMLNVHLIPHSHDDVGWLKTADQYYTGEYPKTNTGEYIFIEGRQCVRCTLNTTIMELMKNPDRRFIFIEMAFFSRYWDEIDEKTREQVKKLIKNRQLEIVLGGWVMSDAAVTYYSDLVDQHTLGFDWIQSTLGPCAQSRVAWHVDQFGHSREHAALFARMGFDALFVGRIDFQDHDIRKRTKTLEFVWETSANAPDHSADLFTQVTFDGYYAPMGFVLDGVHDLFSPVQRTSSVENFLSIVRERAASFKTNHLLMPMGSDFGYRKAHEWFENMDNLIKYVNEKQNSGGGGTRDGPKVNVLYSTPSCYVHHVNRANQSWVTKRDDFHPYGIGPGAYWTGYFTSRAGQKLLVNRASATLQTCKQLGIFSQLKNAFNRTDNLRKAVAVMQHHDAITGTEKQHVSNDYNRMLSEGILNCQSVIGEALGNLLQLTPAEKDGLSFCNKLNISLCPATEKEGQVQVLVYNPLSRVVSTWLRFPVTQYQVEVTSSLGERVDSQLLVTGEGVLRVPERDPSSSSDTEVVFPAKLPPMGYTSFTLSTHPGGQKPMRAYQGKGDVVIENKHLKVTFDGVTGRLKEVENLSSQKSIKVSQDMAYYRGVQGGFRSSGAYVFIPEKEMPHRVGDKDPVHIRVYNGPLVQEVHQQFSTWASQVIRLYKDSRHLELEWTVGPIPSTQDGQGKEVVSYFVSDLKNQGKFYTDSNGREVLERRLNHRETWNLTVVDPISGNYYPVTSRIYIQDKARDIQLTILPDRCQGGSSIHEGTLELMVHRRLLFDDGLGVGEPLDEKGRDRDGIVYSGKHLLFLDTIDNSALLTREMALQVHFAPTFTFRPLTSNNDPNVELQKMRLQKSFLKEALPRNVQVLSLDYTPHGGSSNHTVLLLRLEHFYESKEHPLLSGPAIVSLKDLFTPFEVVEAEEVSLGGNFSPGSHSRLKWSSKNGHRNPASIASSDYRAVMEEPFTVTLRPMDIRTFRIIVSLPSSSSSFFFS